MEIKDRIKVILGHYHLSTSEFATKANIKTGQAVYDLLSGKTKSISTSMENKILSCFPDLNRVWLLTGEGEMLKSQQHVINSNNTNSTINESATIAKLIEMIEAKDKQLAEKDKQIAEKDKQIAEKDKQLESLLKLLTK